jgi:hypothetical protein
MGRTIVVLDRDLDRVDLDTFHYRSPGPEWYRE